VAREGPTQAVAVDELLSDAADLGVAAVFDLGVGCVRLDRLNAHHGVGLRLVIPSSGRGIVSGRDRQGAEVGLHEVAGVEAE
jgi:hypothetical protein